MSVDTISKGTFPGRRHPFDVGQQRHQKERRRGRGAGGVTGTGSLREGGWVEGAEGGSRWGGREREPRRRRYDCVAALVGKSSRKIDKIVQLLHSPAARLKNIGQLTTVSLLLESLRCCFGCRLVTAAAGPLPVQLSLLLLVSSLLLSSLLLLLLPLLSAVDFHKLSFFR